jgi:hypothetical protein
LFERNSRRKSRIVEVEALVSTPDRPLLSRSRKAAQAHFDATHSRVPSRLAEGMARHPLGSLLNDSSQVRALAQLRRSLNATPIQRLKKLPDGNEYEIGDLVLYGDRPHVVVRVDQLR